MKRINKRVMARLDRATQRPRVCAAKEHDMQGFYARVDTRALGPPLSRGMTLIFFIAAMSAPAGAADKVPEMGGLWGRASLNLEQPLTGPGPIVNIMRTPDGTMDMNKLVGDYNSPILKPEAAAILKRRGEDSLKGVVSRDPHNQCRPEPPPYIFAVQFAFEMVQGKDEVALIYSHDNKVRHVRLNATHPAHVVPTGQGDSVGHYEGDELVVDTVGIEVTPISALDWMGTPHSSQLHVIERYRLIDQEEAKAAAKRHDLQYRKNPRPNPNGIAIDPNYKGKGLQIELTVDDPGMFTMPWQALVTYQRALGELWEMRCAENFHEYYANADAPIPQATRPDF
jgi:hypothetical protein